MYGRWPATLKPERPLGHLLRTFQRLRIVRGRLPPSAPLALTAAVRPALRDQLPGRLEAARLRAPEQPPTPGAARAKQGQRPRDATAASLFNVGIDEGFLAAVKGLILHRHAILLARPDAVSSA
jgi:hypothetical protein